MAEPMELALNRLPSLSEDDQTVLADFALASSGLPLNLAVKKQAAIEAGFDDTSREIFAPERAAEYA